MYAIMSDLGEYLVNRYALCLKGSNMPHPPLLPLFAAYRLGMILPILVPLL